MAPLSLHHQLQSLSEKKRPIAWLVFFGLILSCALVCVLAAWQIWTSRSDRLIDARVATSNIARVLALHAETTMRAADLVLEDLVERAEQESMADTNRERFRLHLERVSEKARELHGLFIYDQGGNWVATSLRRTVNANNSDREYFQYHQSNSDRRTRIGAPIRSRSSGVWIIPISRRIERRDGSFAGVALATLKLDFFESAYNKLDLGQAGTVLLALDRGTLYYRRPFTEKIIGTDISGGPLMTFYRTNGPVGTSVLTAKIDGIKRLYSYRHLGAFPLIVAAALSEDEIYANWWSTTVQLISALGFFIIVLVWLGGKLLRQLAIRERLEHQLHLVSEGLAQANNDLSALALKDGLTGLANRRAFDITLQQEFARARRNKTTVSLLILDVDYFKKFNDSYGHPAGDACLQKVGNAIARQVTRQTDFVARYGGEEFVVLLPATDQTGVAAVAERIRQSVYELDIAHESGMDNRVTVSLGAATVEPSSSLSRDGEQLLVAADTALYTSKSAGRNCVTISEVST